VGQLHTKGGFGLGDFVSMVGADMVDAAGVNINRFTKYGVYNRRAFQVPSRKAWAPLTAPVHAVLSKPADPKKPQAEILRIFLSRISYNFAASGYFFIG
jgi:hypothetical protein